MAANSPTTGRPRDGEATAAQHVQRPAPGQRPLHRQVGVAAQSPPACAKDGPPAPRQRQRHAPYSAKSLAMTLLKSKLSHFSLDDQSGSLHQVDDLTLVCAHAGPIPAAQEAPPAARNEESVPLRLAR